MIYNLEDLSVVYARISEVVSSCLAPELADRLVWSRKPFRHGSKTDMVLFNAWDCEQTGLERNQFNYCLNYKPRRPEPDGSIWLLQVRCNMQRVAKVYPKVRDAVPLELRTLERRCPKPFVYREDEQTVELRYTFNFGRSLKTLPSYIAPKFQKLIEAAHPTLLNAIELFHRHAPPKSMGTVGTLVTRHREIQKDLSVYSGSLSAKMKREILERYGHCCARCNKPTHKGDLEFHHITFKSKGGLRTVENFAPLHVVCHDDVHRVADQNGNLPPTFLGKAQAR
jgi:hypothetical protein